MPDPYQTLGVKRDATADEIRAAYRKLAKQHHPDLNPGNAKAEEKFKAVASAHDLLSDPVKRGKFDRGEIDAEGHERAPQYSYREHAEADGGRRYARGGWPGAGGPGGGGPGGGGPGGGAGPSDAGQFHEDDLHDLFSMFGQDGFGTTRERDGTPRPRRGHHEHYTLAVEFLDAVNGATPRLTLPDGRVLDVKIPPGTEDGQVLRLRAQGGAGLNGGPHGDALIQVAVKPHRFFVRDGQDIRLDLPVSLSEAVLGGPVEIPTPKGPVRMQVPKHADNGTKLRLRGRGVPAHGKLAAGDLYATLRVMVGTPDPALEEFLRNWKPEHGADPRRDMKSQSGGGS